MPPLVRIPSGPITPHGAYHVLHDRIPQMGLVSHDETVSINLMGGLSIADKYLAPGRVEVKDLKGLMAPWRTIDQKGATEDGTTFVTALYDPIDVGLGVRVKGKDPADCRRISRYLLDSLDIKEQARLWWFTHRAGYWWSDVRWQNVPMDSVEGIKSKTQNWGLRLRADNGFWQSFPCVEQFLFGYASAKDDFKTNDPDDLGTGWTVAMSGATGTGHALIADGQAYSNMQGPRTMVARKNGFASATNNQVIDIEIGTHRDWYYPTDAYDSIWARLNNSGTPGTTGVQLEIMRNRLILSKVVSGVRTTLRDRIMIIPPLTGEKWRLVVGEEGNENSIKVLRSGATIINMVAPAGLPTGATNRGAGLGMRSSFVQIPAGIRYWAVGDNTTVTQTGFIRRVNAGDQDMWDRYTLFGPGLFRIWNGPGAGIDEYVEFGPLLPNQIMQIRSDPRKRGVVDMTAIPPSPQQLNFLQQALKDFLSFATGNNATPLAVEIESIFGITPPQGNPFSLMRGRFNKPIPPKSPGKPAEEYHIKVSIDDGNADSKIIATGTPLRRMPF